MKYVVLFILVAHGLIHLMGFVRSVRPVAVPQIKKDISRTEGYLWLLVTLLFIACAVLMITGSALWWMAGVPAILISQVLILRHWKEAKFGTIINLLLLIVVTEAGAKARFYGQYRHDVSQALQGVKDKNPSVLEEADMQHLPYAVQQYLRFSGCVGKPKVSSWKITFEGEMRGQHQDWFPFHSEQYNTLYNCERMFFMTGRIKGLEVPGYHHLSGAGATMCIKLFGLIPVIDQHGPEMDTAEAVTFLNDMCLMAPATLIDPRISWQETDSHQVIVTMPIHDISVSATLLFGDDGRLVNFISDDRYDISGDAPHKLRFSTPVMSYREIHGQQAIDYGEAIWHYPEGEFVYGKFKTVAVEYNTMGL